MAMPESWRSNLDAPRWTEGQDRLLAERYATAETHELLRLLPGRSWGAIFHRAKVLKLPKRDPDARHRRYEATSVIGHLSEAERGYLAGLFDGEGCVGLYKLVRTERSGRYTSYNVTVSISNANREVIEWVNARIPATIVVGKKRSAKHRVVYQWTMGGGVRPRIFCQEIAPSLIVKREQAELMAVGWLHLSNAERLALYWRMRALKRAPASGHLSA